MSTEILKETEPLKVEGEKSEQKGPKPLMREQEPAPQHNPFGFKAADLVDMFDPKNKDALDALGGLNAILKGLKVDPEVGLKKDESFGAEADDFVPDVVQEGGFMAKFKKPEAVVQVNNFKARSRIFGRNVLPPSPTKNILQLMIAAMEDKILILLSIAAVVSLGIGIYQDQNDPGGLHWVEGFAIIIAIIIVVLVQSINDYQKEQQFRKLNAKKDDRVVKVRRDGLLEQISIFDVQVGDIMCLEPGDMINVDGILISGHNLRVDESSATGESDLIRKLPYSTSRDCKDPFILSGGKVNEGVGEFVVTCVGKRSFFGKTMMSLRVPPEDTPLQVKLDNLAEVIAKLGSSIAVLLLIVLLIRYLIVSATNGWASGEQVAQDIISIFIEAVVIIVVAVPEGLPLAVTLALAYATRRMMKDNNLVRILASCETMGGATTICSDKTGTLTTNRMTVVAGILGCTLGFQGDAGIKKVKEKYIDSDTKGIMSPENNPKNGSPYFTPLNLLYVLCEGVAINSTAFEEKKNGKTAILGNKTETALLEWVTKLGLTNFMEVRQNTAKAVVQVYPFSSARKSMSTVIKKYFPDGSMVYRVYTKGASEIILDFCDKVLVFEDDSKKTVKTEAMTEKTKENLGSVISGYADQALRTIGIAYCDLSPSEFLSIIGPSTTGSKGKAEDLVDLEPAQSEALENYFHGHGTMLSIVGIEDPLRDGVAEAVRKCQKAGVFVRMVTGDNINTAKAIATKCGILMKGGIALEGPRFRNMSVEEMDAILPRLQVLARSSPNDKQILVQRLKALNETVAVTGDGTNDGPALKMADVGFSMGIAGTEVAKEASAIVLLDDNFSSIVRAMLWGRCVNDSVKKFLQFQLTVNVSAVVIAFVTACVSANNKSVLTAIQLLWINLLMDSLAALALATDPPSDELLDRYPEGKKSPLISILMMKMIFGQAAFQIVVCLILTFTAKDLAPSGWNDADKELAVSSMVFNTFVFFQFFNEINCRRIDTRLNVFAGIHKNWIFISILILTVIIQVILMLFGGKVFNVIGPSLPAIMWVLSIVIPAFTLLVGVFIRLTPNWDGCYICGVPVGVPDNSRVVMTKERLQWLAAIGTVKTQVSVFRALRGTSRPGASTMNTLGDDLDKNSISSSYSSKISVSGKSGQENIPMLPVYPKETFN
ncbi:hypothetical protein MP638_007205 [Amoeboaphelidium occidentale]|nr:hypothetical protein MP638_007205 [Amoeboaphelidium occidentale]